MVWVCAGGEVVVGGVRCWQIQGFRGGDEDENGLTVVGKNIFIGLHSFALFMV